MGDDDAVARRKSLEYGVEVERGEDDGEVLVHNTDLIKEVSSRDAFANFINKLLNSTGYSIFYIVMIVINLVLITWLIANRNSSEHWAFIALELVINFSLGLEISLKLITQRKNYWKSMSNIFDVIVLVLCIVSLLLFIVDPSPAEEIEDIFSVGLLIFRYLLQFLRLISLIKNQHQKFVNNSHDNQIDFSTLEGLDDDDAIELGKVHREDSTDEITFDSSSGSSDSD